MYNHLTAITRRKAWKRIKRTTMTLTTDKPVGTSNQTIPTTQSNQEWHNEIWRRLIEKKPKIPWIPHIETTQVEHLYRPSNLEHCWNTQMTAIPIQKPSHVAWKYNLKSAPKHPNKTITTKNTTWNHTEKPHLETTTNRHPGNRDKPLPTWTTI